ncbi:hypothetical protein [Polaribacter sargassicola]|uniref:hypothetical protein n=1 Tax=Polaribacter sargassicola TaxID=2836891 RepID=UPI001F306F17|nr:hypothetical protein [Polaribacter sp. DS7-9]MCG1035223.1 hypothetical protein [Polaribacter sp. DS7-9]
MKVLKYILVIFISLSITSCSDNEENNTPLSLTNENIAGNYNISSLFLKTEIISETEVSGVNLPVTLATSSSVGDTFQIDFIFNLDGTFEAKGLYRLVSTITPITGGTIENIEIIELNDSGTYNINTIDNTISFSSINTDGLINGDVQVDIFNETTLSFAKYAEEEDGANTVILEYNITLIKE